MTAYLDEFDNKIIMLARQSDGVSISDLSRELYLTNDAVRRRANKLKQKGYLSCQKIKTNNPSPPIHLFRIASEPVIKMMEKSSLNGQEPFFSRIQNFGETTIFTLFVLLLLGKATSPEIAEILNMTPQATRYHLDMLMADPKLVFRIKRNDITSSYQYFLDPNLNRQVLKLAVKDIDNPDKELEIQNNANLLKKNDPKVSWIKSQIAKLNPIAVKLIKAIYWEQGLSNKLLSERINESVGNVGYHAGCLEKIGLVNRINDPTYKPSIKYLNFPCFLLSTDAYKLVFGGHPDFMSVCEDEITSDSETSSVSEEGKVSSLKSPIVEALGKVPQSQHGFNTSDCFEGSLESLQASLTSEEAYPGISSLRLDNRDTEDTDPQSYTGFVNTENSPETPKSIKFDELNKIIFVARHCLAAKKNYDNFKNDLSLEFERLTEEYGEDFKKLFRTIFPSEKF